MQHDWFFHVLNSDAAARTRVLFEVGELDLTGRIDHLIFFVSRYHRVALTALDFSRI